MIYAVNKQTKEHCVPTLVHGRLDNWSIIEADADGWIEWRRGMEQPVADDQIVDVKCASDYWENAYGIEASAVGWSVASDVTHYRPILKHPDQPKEWRGPEDGLKAGDKYEYSFAAFQGERSNDMRDAVIFIGMDGANAVIKTSHGNFTSTSPRCLRPIRTDRERWVEAAEKAANFEDKVLRPANERIGFIYDALQRGDLPMPGDV